MAFDDDLLPRDVTFARDPLRVAVAQIRFPVTFSLRDAAVLAEFQKSIPDYPKATEPTTRTDLEIPGGPRLALTQHAPARFADAAERWLISLAPDSLSIETTEYPGWEAFRERVESVLRAAADFLPTELSRVGLRYVNEISHTGAERIEDWAQLLDPAMIAFTTGPRIGPRVRRTLEQISLELDDDGITLRHGFVSRADLPDTAPSSVYLIDVDAFSDSPGERDTDALMARFERYHAYAWTLFRGSLGPDLVEALGGEPVR